MRNFIVFLYLICLGCGGAQPQAEEAAPFGEEGFAEPGAAEPEPFEEEEAPAEPARGPASISVTPKVVGQAVSGSVKIVNEAGETVAEGSAGQNINVQSGHYTVEVRVTDEKTLADRPTRTMEVDLQPGAQARQEMSFPWCKVRVIVRVKGKKTGRATVKLLRNGEHVATLQSGAQQYVPLSPGRYQAEVKSGGLVTTLDEVMFPEGGTRDVPIDVSF
jgi:hypothetical protein